MLCIVLLFGSCNLSIVWSQVWMELERRYTPIYTPARWAPHVSWVRSSHGTCVTHRLHSEHEMVHSSSK